MKIGFVQFFGPKMPNIIMSYLKRINPNLIRDDKNPDVMFYCTKGSRTCGARCKKVFVSGESAPVRGGQYQISCYSGGANLFELKNSELLYLHNHGNFNGLYRNLIKNRGLAT